MGWVRAGSAEIAYVAAAGGSVAKNAVSNTATWGTSNSPRAAWMPATAPGLCSGASGISSEISAITASVMITGSEKSGPPCTTRWPTARNPTVSRSMPASVRAAFISVMAALWSATPPGSPIRSTSPLASTPPPSGTSSWYFSDEDPALSTRTGDACGAGLMPSPSPGEDSTSGEFSTGKRRRTGDNPPLVEFSPSRSRHPLSLHRGDGDRVHDVLDQRPAGQVVHRLLQALQHRPDGDGVGAALHRLVGVF